MRRVIRSPLMPALTNRSPPVIKIPYAVSRNMDRVKARMWEKQKERAAIEASQGFRSVPVISCMKKKLNHYYGQTYSKASPMVLASKGWFHYKAPCAGDHFTICTHGSQPSWQGESDSLSFDGLKVDPRLVANLKDLNIRTPTNVQALAIPEISIGKNVMCFAETGNGKTLAFLLPMLQRIAAAKSAGMPRPERSPLAFILAPSVQLVLQIGEACLKVSKDLPVNTRVLVRNQKLSSKESENDADLVIATPQALVDKIKSGDYNMACAQQIVMDEIDTLLDDSFSEDVLFLLQNASLQNTVPNSLAEVTGTQLVFVGATFPKNMHATLQGVVDMRSMVKLTTDYLHKIMPHIPQKFVRMKPKEKPAKILEMAKEAVARTTSTIIFTGKATTCNWLGRFLRDNNTTNVVLNASIKPDIRDKYYQQFKDREVYVMVATDMASRGLDTTFVKHVINYDLSDNMSDYIHRAGRVGRVGSRAGGRITNLVSRPWEVELVQTIEAAVRNMIPLNKVDANIKRKLQLKVMEKKDKFWDV